MRAFDRNLSSPSLLECLVSQQAKNYIPIAITSRGGGASGREMAICSRRPGSNPVTVSSFFGSDFSPLQHNQEQGGGGKYEVSLALNLIKFPSTLWYGPNSICYSFAIDHNYGEIPHICT